MRKKPLSEVKDNFIRDVCSVYPLSKSEVRRRLDEIIKESVEEYNKQLKQNI
jgi:hypothetical protein